MESVVHLALAAGISFSYVGLLYAFDYNGVDRNSEESIRRRFLAATVNNVVGVGATYAVLKKQHSSPFSSMGIHTEGILFALILPAALTCICYLGTWVMTYIDGHLSSILDLSDWKRCFMNLTWIRDAIMAPVTEELAFRACTAALVLEVFSPKVAVFIAPLPFALSHLHHIFDDMRKGTSKQAAVLRRAFQMSYSYLFGAYATFLFVRTGNIVAPIISHSICNSMGLPLFGYIKHYPDRSTRILLWSSYIAGFVAWLLLLKPLTEPALYR